MNKPTKKERRAQSLRDKAANRSSVRRRARNNNTRVVRAPLATSRAVVRSAPSMAAKADTMQFHHTEVFAELTSDGADFQSYSAACNPGYSTRFPWTHMIARAYDWYIPHKIEFIVEPVLPATTAGSYWLYADSDTVDDAPADFTGASCNAHFKSASVWTRTTCSYPANFFNSRKKFRILGDDLSNTSPEDSDCLRLWYGTTGVTHVGLVARIMIRYHFTFSNPSRFRDSTCSLELTCPATFDMTMSATPYEQDLSGYVVTSKQGTLPFACPEVGQSFDNNGIRFLTNASGELQAKWRGIKDVTAVTGASDMTIANLTSLLSQIALTGSPHATFAGLGQNAGAAKTSTHYDQYRVDDEVAMSNLTANSSNVAFRLSSVLNQAIRFTSGVTKLFLAWNPSQQAQKLNAYAT